MPVIDPNQQEHTAVLAADYGEFYDGLYPEGLDLKPGSEDHAKIAKMILDKAQAAWDVMSDRHDAWDEISRTLTSYIPTSEAEREVVEEDSRKPVSIVIPQSFAVLDTIMTQCMDTFLSDTIFRYRGWGPEDTVGAMLLEKVVELQVERFKVALGLHTAWRDGFAYGLGISSPIWTAEMGKVRRPVETGGRFSQLYRRIIGQETEFEDVEEVLFEGNRVEEIDPYTFLPDPNVSAHRIQDAEFVGWVSHDNRMSLLTREGQGEVEQGGEGLFNVRYLEHVKNRISKFAPKDETERTSMLTSYTSAANNIGTTNPVDVIWMYVNLVPKEWKLSTYDRPEKWMFGLASDSVVIAAQPLNLDHGKYPICVCAPEFDGYTISPLSRLETTYGLQKAIDWMWNAHVANVRKAVNDMLIYDPMMVSATDMNDPKPGKLIRLRKSAWGRGVDNVVKQLQVNDITRGNVTDIAVLSELMQRGSGAADILQGISRRGGERRSATEVASTSRAATSRLDRAITVISLQYMNDMAGLFAAQTKQLQSQESYVLAEGMWGKTLAKEYNVGVEGGRTLVRPADLNMRYDVVPYSNATKGSEFADTWVQVLQIAANNPELAQRLDIVRLFSHTARLMGAKNIEDFQRSANDTQIQVQPDEQVMDQVQAGNLVPSGAA